MMEQWLQETLASGGLERQLREQFDRWRDGMDFDEFKDSVLSRAWERREQFRGASSAEFLSWLRKIARSVAVDRMRAKKRETSLWQRLSFLLPRFARPHDERIQLKDLVDWLLAGLNDRERKLLSLKYFQNCATDEIATQLDTTEAGVRQMHRRALVKLRHRLKEKAE